MQWCVLAVLCGSRSVRWCWGKTKVHDSEASWGMEKPARSKIKRKKRPWEPGHPMLLTQKTIKVLEKIPVLHRALGSQGWDVGWREGAEEAVQSICKKLDTRPSPAQQGYRLHKGLGSQAGGRCLWYTLGSRQASKAPRRPVLATSQPLSSPSVPQPSSVFCLVSCLIYLTLQAELVVLGSEPRQPTEQSISFHVNGKWEKKYPEEDLNSFHELRKITKPNKRLSSVHSTMQSLIHSFIPTHSPLRPHPPLTHLLPYWALQSSLTSQWSCFSGTLSSFTPTPMCSFPPLLSLPMAVFFFKFQKKTYKNCWNIHYKAKPYIFFNIQQRAPCPPPPKKPAAMSKTLPPPLTFMQCSESAGVSALTNLHLFECDAWKKPEPLD